MEIQLQDLIEQIKKDGVASAELEAEGWPVHRQMPEGRHNETLLLVWSWCPRLPDPTQLAHTPGLRHQLSHWFCELLTTFQ